MHTLFTDEVGGVVDDSGIESCVGGLVVAEADTAAAITEMTATAAAAAAAADEDEQAEDDDGICGTAAEQQVVGYGGFYQAVVAVHPPRMHAGFANQAQDTQLHDTSEEEHSILVENGNEDDEDEEYTEFETDVMEDVDSEDLEEITVYELEEISNEMLPCEIIVEEEPDRAAQCIAILLETPEETTLVQETAAKTNRIGEAAAADLTANASPIRNNSRPLNKDNVKRRRNKGRRRRSRRRWP